MTTEPIDGEYITQKTGEVIPELLPEIILPDSVLSELILTTSNALNALLIYDESKKMYSKRNGAPDILVIPYRSGVIAASGIIDFLAKHNVESIGVLTLRGLGYEMEEICGSIYFDDYKMGTSQEELDYFAIEYAKSLNQPESPPNTSVRELAEAIEKFEGQKIEIGLLDDYIFEGGVSEVMMPIFVKQAANMAGLDPKNVDAELPTMQELIQRHFIDETPHTNSYFVDQDPMPQGHAPDKLISYRPNRALVIFPNHSHWISEIVEATFGNDLGTTELGLLDEFMRGETDFEGNTTQAAIDIAMSRGINYRGFDAQYDRVINGSRAYRNVKANVGKSGVSENAIPEYLLSLSHRLKQTIIGALEPHYKGIEDTIKRK